MNGSMDADELAAQLLEGLDALKVGSMLRAELSRRLVELGMAASPPSPRGDRRPQRGVYHMREAFARAIEIASGGEIRITEGLVRRVHDPSGRHLISYSGGGEPLWNDVVERHGPEAFAERVLQLLEGEIGGGYEAGFGLGGARSRTLALRPVEVVVRGSDPG